MCKEYIEREAVCYQLAKQATIDGQPRAIKRAAKIVANFPAADVRPVPDGGMGDMSDGYHTFNGLYYQRMVLFAALVKAHKDKAWKSWRHEDGELCFGKDNYFIVGIDTPQGSYTYHYHGEHWDLFDCRELPVAKHWDGHTEKDVTRLLSLDVQPVVRAHWYWDKDGMDWGIGAWRCSACKTMSPMWWNADRGSPMHKSGHRYCPNCGADMREEQTS